VLSSAVDELIEYDPNLLHADVGSWHFSAVCSMHEMVEFASASGAILK
jgi:hypothetical protein